MIESGIRQFLDIGSGVPIVGGLHAIIHRAGPEARMVYADRDPVATALAEQTRRLLGIGEPICPSRR